MRDGREPCVVNNALDLGIDSKPLLKRVSSLRLDDGLGGRKSGSLDYPSSDNYERSQSMLTLGISRFRRHPSEAGSSFKAVC